MFIVLFAKNSYATKKIDLNKEDNVTSSQNEQQKTESLNKSNLDALELKQGFVIPFDFRTSFKKLNFTSCELSLTGITSKNQYKLTINWGGEYHQTEAEVDSYKLTAIECGTQKWNFKQNSVGVFQVYKNKYSLLNPFEILLDLDNSLHVVSGVKGHNQTLLLNTVKQLDTLIVKKLVSGYNGMNISQQILEHKIDLNYSFRSNNQLQVKNEIFKDLSINHCLVKEEKNNPIMYGELQISIDFSRAKHLIHKLEIETATISNETKKCIFDHVKKFNFKKYNVYSAVIKF